MAPFFVIGAMLADLEVSDKNYRPLDKFRNLSPKMTIVKNTVLFLVFLIYGSYHGNADCYEDDVDCTFIWLISFGNRFNFIYANRLAVISVFLLALTSEGVQKFLLTKPMQFLGKISYTFYLIHLVFVDTMMFKLVNFMSGYDVDKKD